MRAKFSFSLLLFSAMAFIASVLYFAPFLPERMATHFNGAGQPNGWMPRNQHILFITLLGFGIPALVIGTSYGIRFLPSSLLNVPNAAYWRTPEKYPEACDKLLRWSLWFGSLSLIWTALLNYLVIDANRSVPPHLAPAPFLALVGIYIATLGILIAVLIFSFRKTDSKE